MIRIIFKKSNNNLPSWIEEEFDILIKEGLFNKAKSIGTLIVIKRKEKPYYIIQSSYIKKSKRKVKLVESKREVKRTLMDAYSAK